MVDYINIFSNESGVTESLNNATLNKPYLALLNNTGKIDWNSKEIDYSQLYFTLEFEERCALTFQKTTVDTPTIHIYYKRINGKYASDKWERYSTSSNPKYYIGVEAGDIVQFKGDNPSYEQFHFRTYDRDSLNTRTYAKFKAYGNVMSLIYNDDFINKTSFPENSSGNFDSLFDNARNLTDASNLVLPAITLNEWCYGGMFADCHSLTQAPELPATTLAKGCYGSMFRDCRSLITAPVLPATTLVDNCYMSMFFRCYSLNYIKCLATDISATNCTNDWVDSVQRVSGTFITPSSTQWTTDDNGIPSGWTRVNSDV